MVKTGLSKQCIYPDQMPQNAASDQGLYIKVVANKKLKTF